MTPANLSISDTLTRNELTWQSQTAYHRAEYFLNSCQKKEIILGFFSSFPYLEFYKKHDLIKVENSLLVLVQTEQLSRFLSECSADNLAQIRRFIISLLNARRQGLGKWVDFRDVDQMTHYQFNARKQTELSYEYALFLLDLGLIQDEQSWIYDNENQLYNCPITTLGSDVLAEIASKNRALSIIVPEGSNPNINVQMAVGGGRIENSNQTNTRIL